MAVTGRMLACVFLALCVAATHAECPYSKLGRKLHEVEVDASLDSGHRRELQQAATSINWNAVKQDIKTMLVTSQDFWPADFGNYGPLMVRLAWHCAGSYRPWDGRGGCDGARIRFDPERSWEDNTNLDKARRLLQPIKLKYGPGLSWGDLIILAGTTALESMGAPTLGFCAGRVDSVDGAESLPLGPSPEQQALAPCDDNGACPAPLATTTLGLMYVNPGGPKGQPDPVASAAEIRDVFTNRMGYNDSETVALIGGGHTFGKCHGPCRTPPGGGPDVDPWNPWQGNCGTGKGQDTYTSGYDGPWTEAPTQWNPDYFKNLLAYNWVPITNSAGKIQWQGRQKPGGQGPQPIMMLTTDVALINDDSYKSWVRKFDINSGGDFGALGNAFAAAWYKLVTRDMGPRTRCLNSDAPASQYWQPPLPPTPAKLADFTAVRADIKAALSASNNVLQPDMVNGRPYYGALFATLAWRCAATFRATDYRGGCNGAYIRLFPQGSYPINFWLDKVLTALSGIKSKYDKSNQGALSWADLIVLAGTTAVEEASGLSLGFCGGRTDATADNGASDYLTPRTFNDPILEFRDNSKVMGLTSREAVALAGMLRSPTQQMRLGYSGSWTSNPSKLSNQFYKDLLNKSWSQNYGPGGNVQWQSTDGSTMLPTDLALKVDAEYLAIVQEFASDNQAFLTTFGTAWTKMMNADRYDGPYKNKCSS